MMITTTLRRIHFRIQARHLPRIVTLKDFDPHGVRFEATTASELHRIAARGYEPEYLGQMLSALAPDDVFFDVGANIGLVALNAARRCRTVAFEPDPEICSRLRRNRQLNPSAPIDIWQIAISDSDGSVELFTDGVDGTSPSLVHQRDERRAAHVDAHALDTLLDSGALPTPTVVKLDIEGAEILALRGATRLMNGAAAPRLLFLELHDSFLPGFGSSAAEVIALVTNAGYRNVRYEARRSDQQHLILAWDGST